MKTIALVVAVLAVALVLSSPVSWVFELMFGLAGGLFGLVVGLAGGMFGLAVGLIAGLFGAVVGLLGGLFGLAVAAFVLAVPLLIVAALALGLLKLVALA